MPVDTTLEFVLGGLPDAGTPNAPLDHVAAAVSRLTEQFKKPNIIALLSLFAQRYNDLEAVAQAMLTLRNVYSATGQSLDIIGRIVGQSRLGLNDDDDYRRFILARITTNRSDGVIEDLIAIAVLVLNDSSAQIIIDNQGIAALVLRIGINAVTDNVANILLDFEQAAVAGGVRLIVETQYDDDADTWCFAQSTVLNGAATAGASTITVVSTAGFPANGTLNIDEALAAQDLGVTYNGVTPTSFLNVSGMAHNHVDQSEVSLAGAGALGLGMGDTSDGTAGGELISARDSHYP
jgi:hypothetical protein